MKRIVSMVILVCMMLSLIACGSGQAEPETEAEMAAVQQTIAATEPTQSAQELLIASLTGKVKQAYEEGIAELALLEDLDRVITTDETVAMIQRIYTLHFGEEAAVLNQAAASVLMGKETTRHWLALMMYAPLAERIYGAAPYETFEESIQWLTVDAVGFVHIDDTFIRNGMVLVGENNPAFYTYDTSYMSNAGIVGYGYGSSSKGVEDLLGTPDLKEFWEEKWDGEMAGRAQSEGWVKWLDYGFRYVHWTTTAADRFTGEKILKGDLDTPFGPREKMTVREAVEAALRYHHFIQPDARRYPYAEVPACDASIITPELLEKQTALPEASCANLPREWKGMTMQNLQFDGDIGMPDNLIQANELDIIQAAGFNYVEICFDFRCLIHESRNLYACRGDEVDGMMSANKLADLDRIIAMCMERDIHVNLSCVGVGGWNLNEAAHFRNSKDAVALAEQWTVLARRYADIPSTYLSFTMYRDPGTLNNKDYAAFFTPVVEAIRAESPDRCIIANVSHYMRDLPVSMAELGVAISCDAPLPDGFGVERYSTPEKQWEKTFQKTQWPYVSRGTTYDAESAMNNYGSPYGQALDEIARMAQEYGVGFMVSNWDAACGSSGRHEFRQRYSDEMIDAYLTDFVTVLEDRGWGWCYGDWDGYMGLACGYPAQDSTTYTQVENVLLYIDDKMMAWFQEINRVS